MRVNFHNPLLALGVLASVFAGCGNAERLVLSSQIGGQYDYGIQLDPNQGIVFMPGESIALTGLAGVTGASVLPSLAPFFMSIVTTPTSATIVATSGIVLDPVPFSQTLSALRVNSTVLTTGLIGYDIETGGGAITGTVTGPVGAVPEPGCLALATGGLLALLGYRRRRVNSSGKV